MKTTKEQRLRKLNTENKNLQRFIDVLTSLSLKEIKIVEFVYIDGMTLNEVGQIMSMTVERVRQLLGKAKQRIIIKMVGNSYEKVDNRNRETNRSRTSA